jgi:cobaltochelatase CobS
MSNQKYVIKSIVKAEDEKAIMKYLRGNKEVKVYRQVYSHEGYDAILFKGIKLGVTFNQQGVATSIEVKEVYDKILKEKEGDKAAEKISVEIQNENNLLPIKEEIKVEAPKIQIKNGSVKHREFDEIKLWVENKVPVYLYGPAGSGKNHVLEQIANELDLDFYFTNSVQQEFKITGFIDAGGKFHETEFYRAWTKGGLFFLDEMDASIPEVLILLNAALANGYFDFPGFGKVDAHKDFRVVAAGNTVGTGADEQYTGRMQLDQATLDRFTFIEFDYDRNIELAITNGNVELVDFIRDLRKQAKDKGINATFSYRCLMMVKKMEGKLDLKKLLKSAVVKGMDQDTIRTFATSASNKYGKALWALKQAN